MNTATIISVLIRISLAMLCVFFVLSLYKREKCPLCGSFMINTDNNKTLYCKNCNFKKIK